MTKLRPEISSLPVAACLPDIVAAVTRSQAVVLKAPPGAGKTTGVPPSLFLENAVGDGKVLLIQPRRLAARSAAARLATMMNSSLGGLVGYQVRFENRTSAATRLIAMTTGILLRRMQDDPLLEDVSCVILDEFHERSLEMDLALGMLQRIRTSFRPELKLIVMSATLAPQPIVEFLGHAVSITSEGRSFPVEVKYTNAPSRERIENQVAKVMPEAMRSTPGHLLVFLPGVGEIHRTQQTLANMRITSECVIQPLYGDLSPKDQDAVLADSNQRKIVLATNVAETSITIPGVTAVIDSGLARVMRFDPQVGLPKLQRELISQASADQRAGRAGRTGPGICYRLWVSQSHRARRQEDAPEILRTDFSSALLTLAAWGEREVFDFPWLTPPSPDSVDSAFKLLSRLGAIDPEGRLTATGQQMIRMPLHPRLSRLMVEAVRYDVIDEASLAAALLTERNPFHGEPASATKTIACCDIADQIERMEATSSRYNVTVTNIKRVADQISRLARSIKPDGESSNPNDRSLKPDRNPDRLSKALLAAYPDRVARRRAGSQDRGVMVGGKGVVLDASSKAPGSDFFLCIDADSGGTEARVRVATAIDQAWLMPSLMREVDEPFFNPTLKAVVARRRHYYDDLLLAETPITCEPNETVAGILFQHAKPHIQSIVNQKDANLDSFIARVRFLTNAMPELDLPALDDTALEVLLQEMCQSRTSIAELQKAPWLDYARGRYSYEQNQSIDKHAPSRITLPSGNTAEIKYGEANSAVLEARIQEIFGWNQTPRVAGGRVPLLLHLLGPNYRPQQITDDLENFWKVTYSEIRKELKRRYPKHHWPDDPTGAVATRNGLKPK